MGNTVRGRYAAACSSGHMATRDPLSSSFAVGKENADIVLAAPRYQSALLVCCVNSASGICAQ